jgi:UDP-glucose 4-epimerase
MNVLVTGGAGYIGSVAVRLLCDEGHCVTVVDNLERGHEAAVDPRASLIIGDIRNENQISSAVRTARPEAIMHFAAYAYVGESMHHPDVYFENNVCGASNLIRAAVENHVTKFVLSSTCATYGQPAALPIYEDTLQKPTNPYGESKLMVEKMLKWMQRIHQIDSVCLRYFNACGAYQDLGEDHAPETHLIPLVLKAAAGGTESVSIYGIDYDTLDGSCVRDYIHIHDLARAHLLALRPGIRGAYNLGTGKGYSVKEVIACVEEVTGRVVKTKTEGRRDGDPACLFASAEKAKDVMGWRPERSSLRTIVEDAWAWMCAHPNGYE